jgi:methyltransferase (TIGR00027 family)
MSGGPVSVTARRVAAYRLVFERLPTDFGQPAADEALSRDVADGESPDLDGAMARYLRGRTAFFDRVVVNALNREMTQVVSLGAGYDGRAWRYAKDGVRWWEVDQAGTQADKRARLARLDIDTRDVTFVTHDLRHAGLADGLVEAGLDPRAPSLVLCEGVAVYLDASWLERALSELRSLATVGSRLATSFGTQASSPSHALERARFEAAVAAWGEPARSSITADEADSLLAAARWRPVEISERARRAGFVMAAPLWSPVAASKPPTRCRIGLFMEKMLYRSGTDALAGHLEATYGLPVAAVRELDLGVYRVDRTDGSRWAARVFPASRSFDAVQEEAEILDWLAREGLPAERGAHSQPVSVLAGQPVLVTDFVSGRQVAATPEVFRALAEILGRLHLLGPGPPRARRPGAAWHHLVLDAGPAEELATARSLFEAARHRVPSTESALSAELADDLWQLDDCEDLPHAFGHPDLVPRNLVGAAAGDQVVIDWTGAGWAPRVLSLGCLLWAAAKRPSCLRAAAAGYCSLISLNSDEVDRLEKAMRTRPLILTCWSFVTGRDNLPDLTTKWRKERAEIHRGAMQAAKYFDF